MKLYIIGISGVMTASIAVAMKHRGWEVSGSDKGFYPPMSTHLANNAITMLIGFKQEHIPQDADIIIIANAITKTNPEYVKAITTKAKIYYGYGSFLADYLIKENSIVCAGTYGKTTLTEIMSYILSKAGVDPSFAIGGVPLDMQNGVQITDSVWSVTEGDEYIDSKLVEKQVPKFMYYHPSMLLLTSAMYDHLDVYPTKETYVQAYKHLLERMPDNSVVFVNRQGENIEEAIAGQENRLRIFFVSTVLDGNRDGCYASLLSYHYEGDIGYFDVHIGERTYTLQTKLIGLHNIQNLTLAFALSTFLDLDEQVLAHAIASCSGVKRRLEIRKKSPFLVIDDLAHSPVKAQSSIHAVKEKYPDRKIYAIFEPHTLSSRIASSLFLYPHHFDSADVVLVAPIYHTQSVSKEQRTSVDQIAQAIGSNARGFETYEQLKDYIRENIKKDDILLCMSSGNLGGLLEFLISYE